MLIVQTVRVMLSVENGISSLQNISSSSLQLGNGVVKDIKIWDDSELLVLFDENGKYWSDFPSCDSISYQARFNDSLEHPV